MASEAKRQKLRNYFYQPHWEEELFVIPVGDGCACLVCGKVFSSNENSSVERHLILNHASLDTDYPKGSTARTLEIEALKLKMVKRKSVDASMIVSSNSNSTTRLSFKAAHILAKSMEPYEDGDILKELMMEMANELIEDQEIRKNLQAKVKDTPLSRQTMARRVMAISSNIHDQLMENLRECAWFSLQLDESTDVSDIAQVSVFVRMVFDDFSTTAELLSIIPLKDRTTGKDVFAALKDMLTMNNVPLAKLVSITTDGTPAMVGRHVGLIALCKEDPDFPAALLNFQCIVHQQALCIKSVDMNHVMQPVIKVVDYIRARPLQHRLFQSLLQEAGEKHDSTLHSEVRSLSRGKVLERFYQVLPEIQTFLKSRNEDVEQLQDPAWLMDLAFFIDLMNKINSLNLEMQGRDIPIWTSIAAVEGFRDDLRHWLDFFRGNLIPPMFESLTKLVQDSGNESDFCGERFARWLRQLAEEFNQRFQEFGPIKKIRNYLFDPMVERDAPENAEIIKDLFPVFHVCTIQEEMACLRRNETCRFRFNKCSSVDEFWQTIPDETTHGILVSLYKRLLSCSASSCSCASTFSSMKDIKSKLRSRLTDDNLECLLRISASSYAPDFEKLAEQAHE